MKKARYILLVVVAVSVGALLFSRDNNKVMSPEVKIVEKVDTVNGIKFSYRTEPKGYVLLEQDGIYQFFLQEEYDVLQDAIARGEGRDGPQSIRVRIFDNESGLTASQWADRFTRESGINIITGEIDREEILAGVNALRYTIDGLYLIDTWVVANGDKIFLLSGPTGSEHPIIGPDFQSFLQSVEFIPTE